MSRPAFQTLARLLSRTVGPVLALAPMTLQAADAGANVYKGNEAVSLSGLLQMASGLVLVLIVIFGIAWFLRRFGRFQGGATEQLRLLGGIHLGQRERIILVQADDVCLVVGVSPGGIRTLHVLPAGQWRETAEKGGNPPSADGFLGRFNEEIRKRMQS